MTKFTSIERRQKRRTNVSALYIDPNGPYPTLLDDCWDKSRDARRYTGPNPVIAHPPCQLWTNFAALNFKRYGGEHNRPGNDGGCFVAAIKAVRVWGGVLEHPAYSKAWATFGLQKPVGLGWSFVGKGPGPRRHWVCEVWQSAYGHKARKRTWLYAVSEQTPPEGIWQRKTGTHQCGRFDRLKPTLSKTEASRTPITFAHWLISIASQSRQVEIKSA